MTAHKVGVTVELHDKVSKVLGLIGGKFAQVHGQAKQLQNTLKSLGVNASMNKLFTGGLMMATGGTMINGAIQLGKALESPVKNAMDLETAMKRLQVNINAGKEEMQGFEKMFLNLSGKTAMSMVDVAGLGVDMANSGIDGDSTKKMKGGDIAKLLPRFTIAADFLYDSKGANRAETVHSLTGLAHQFGKYTPEEMNPIIERVVKLSNKLPGSLNSFVTMGGYVNTPATRVLGVDPLKLLTLEAVAMQTVGGGSGGARGGLSGSSIMAALSRTVPGVLGAGLTEGKTMFALKNLGLVDKYSASTVKDAKGNLDLDKLLTKLNHFGENLKEPGQMKVLAKKMMDNIGLYPAKQQDQMMKFLIPIHQGKANVAPYEMIQKLFTWSFGVNGARAFSMMAEPKFMGAMKKTENYVNDGRSLEELQIEIQGNLRQNLERLTEAFRNLDTMIGQHIVPQITPLVSGMADLIQKSAVFLQQNPQLSDFLAKMAMAAPPILLVGGAILTVSGALIILNQGFIALTALWPAITAGAAAVGSAFAMSLAPAILTVTGVVGGLVVVVMHWKTISKWLSAALVNIEALARTAFPFLKEGLDRAHAAVMWFGKGIMWLVGQFMEGIKLLQGGMSFMNAWGGGSDGGKNPIQEWVSGFKARFDEEKRQIGIRNSMYQAGGRGSAAASTSIGAIHMNITQKEGQNGEQLAKQIKKELHSSVDKHSRSTTTGVGIYESPFYSGHQ